MLKDYLASLTSENLLQANETSLDALVNFLKAQPFYYQCYFGERIVEHLKEQFEKHKWYRIIFEFFSDFLLIFFYL